VFIKELILTNFKNYPHQKFSFAAGLNFLVGKNGAGKTNILDAIHVLCFTKSHFNHIDADLIRYATDFFRVECTYQSGEQMHQVAVSLMKNKRKNLVLDEKSYKKFSDHIGVLPCVMIAPGDQVIIAGGSEERRKLYDSTLCQCDHDYLEALLRYNQVLEQRNAFLKQSAQQHKRPDVELMQIYNQKLATDGQLIFEKRKAAMIEIESLFHHYYERLASKDEHISLRYSSHLFDDHLAHLLEHSLSKDLILEYTTKGIHKDDLKILIDDNPAKKFASQGQQKSFLIAIKFSLLMYISKRNQTQPIFLIDDLFDKLDYERCKNLIEIIQEKEFGQIFLTDTDMERIEKLFAFSIKDARIYLIADNEATLVNKNL
jgi:DNA replication and repair protein RecF